MPERRCVVCRKSGPKEELLRFVGREGALTVDVTGGGWGRGAYAHAHPSCLGDKRLREKLVRSLRGAPLKGEIEFALQEGIQSLAKGGKNRDRLLRGRLCALQRALSS